MEFKVTLKITTTPELIIVENNEFAFYSAIAEETDGSLYEIRWSSIENGVKQIIDWNKPYTAICQTSDLSFQNITLLDISILNTVVL